VKILDLSEIIPTKLLKKGITVLHYEGWPERHSFVVKKRETPPHYLPRAKATFSQISIVLHWSYIKHCRCCLYRGFERPFRIGRSNYPA
jgi:hypothetical protein